MTVIETENLNRSFKLPQREPGFVSSIKQVFAPRFKTKIAVDGLSLKVASGETLGFIGVNGSGKSTTVKMLTGILYPSGGTVHVLNKHPYQNRSKTATQIGVVSGLTHQNQRR